VQPFRPPLVVRRLSVKDHRLESLAVEVTEGGLQVVEHIAEEVQVAEDEDKLQHDKKSTNNAYIRRASTANSSSNATRRLSLFQVPTRAEVEADMLRLQQVSEELERCRSISAARRQLVELGSAELAHVSDFAHSFCPLQVVANQVLHQTSERRDDVVQELLQYPRSILPSQSSTHSVSSYDSNDPDIPLCLIPQKPRYEHPEALPARVMLWRKAAAQFNKGLLNVGDVVQERRRQQAYDRGVKLYKREFRSYADKDHWEALDQWQQRLADTLNEALQKRLKTVKALRRATAKASAQMHLLQHDSDMSDCEEGEFSLEAIKQGRVSPLQMEIFARDIYRQTTEEENKLRIQIQRMQTILSQLGKGDAEVFLRIDQELHQIQTWLQESGYLKLDTVIPESAPEEKKPIPTTNRTPFQSSSEESKGEEKPKKGRNRKMSILELPESTTDEDVVQALKSIVIEN
jgi:hypothetical protein